MEYIKAKTIVTRTKSSAWFGTDYNMNIYRGCCHGCIYCDSRSECYGTDDFDTVRAKENALEIIRNDLRRKVKTGVIGTGAMSDPYNPFEKELLLTRHALELVNAYEFGVAIATKSDLIVCDADILCEIKEHSPVLCKVTITAADDALAKKVEPNAPASSQRFKAIEALAEKGIYSGVLLMPVLPFIEDSEENVVEIVRKAKASGARFVFGAFGVTLRQNQREYFLNEIEKRFKGEGLREKYIKTYGNSYSCSSPSAKKLWKTFTAECERLGLLYKMQDITSSYKKGYGDAQLSFY